MLDRNHQNFLGKFFKADTHYTKDEAPTQWLRNSKKVTHQDIDDALNHRGDNVRVVALQHKNATKEHFDKALNDDVWVVRAFAIKNHPNLTKEHIDKALNDSDETVREYAIRHPNASEENITKALNDSSWAVRYNAIKHPNVTKDNISKALNDNDEDVRSAAMENPNYRKYFPRGHQ